MDFRDEHYQSIMLATERGNIDCRYYPSTATTSITKEHRHEGQLSAATIFVTGVGGDWGTPAEGLYPRLCNSLSREHGFSGLRIRYRHPTDLEEAVFDVLTGITFLKDNEGIRKIGLVGHSFGGAVVLQAAAAASNIVSTVVTLATQSYGAIDAIAKLKDSGVSILLIHGTEDNVLPIHCSKQIYRLAPEPKQLVLLRGAGHSLDEDSESIHKQVYEWLVCYLTVQR